MRHMHGLPISDNTDSIQNHMAGKSNLFVTVSSLLKFNGLVFNCLSNCSESTVCPQFIVREAGVGICLCVNLNVAEILLYEYRY